MALILIGIIVLIIGIFSGKNSSPLYRFRGLLILGSIIIIIIGFATSALRQIDAGHIGVQVMFGQVQPNVIYEGLNVVNPLVDITQMSVQTQNYTMSAVSAEGQHQGDDAIRVLSRDGLEVVIDLTVLYRVVATEAPKMLREIGVDYQDKIIRPITRTGIRESASYFDAIDLFSVKREEFEKKINEKIDRDFLKNGLVVEQLLIRNINLPTSVKESIERKITAVQDAQRMKFVLEKEMQESERKRVEAQGNADAQRIVSMALTDKVLQFEMIKVQKELATSPNSKIIIMGAGQKAPPFIIGN